MENTFIMYGHGGCENHGCEAIVKSLTEIIKKQNVETKIVLAKQSETIGADETAQISVEREILQNSVNKLSLSYVIAGIKYVLFGDKRAYFELLYKDLLSCLDGTDAVCISIGGDNYCYNMHNSLYFLDSEIRKRNMYNVLWGCSIEPDSLSDKDLVEDLNGFDLVLARESITFKALTEVLNTRVCLYPDPAFYLEPHIVEFDKEFCKNGVVGINISPVIARNVDGINITFENYRTLVNYIISETQYNIALIPHVTWNKNNDLEPLGEIYNIFKNTGRINLIPECDCCKAKGYISQCTMFIGARTHSTIAAYSMCVPTLVVGYSVKALGIARDIFGTSEHYVVDSRNIKDSNRLTEEFYYLDKEKENIKNHLMSFMPEYIKNAAEAFKEIRRG